MLALIAVIVAALSWWVTNKLARGGWLAVALDQPNQRSLHSVPTPRTGGVAILMSVCCGLLLSAIIAVGKAPEWISWTDHPPEAFWILVLALGLGIVSFFDDRKGLPIWVRLGYHIGAACGVMAGAQLVIHVVTVPVLGSVQLGWLAVPLTLGFILWMTNLYNFMDGMDGFAGGMTVFGFGLLGYLFWQAHHPVISVIATLQSAAAAGFLVHNFPPAKIFLGDVGSVPTGFLASALIVLGCRDGVFDLWVPLIIFSPFILDATLTLIRRALRREKIWEAHRDHYYQRLVLGGWSHRRTVLVEYGVMALCGGFALFYQNASGERRLALLGEGVMLFFFLALAAWVWSNRYNQSGFERIVGPTTPLIAMPSLEQVSYFDTLVRVVLAVYIAVLPFKALLVLERNGFILLLGLLIVWCVINRRLFYTRTPYDMLLLAFVVWVGLTIPFSVAPSYSLKEYGKLLQQMVVFYAVIYFFKGLRYRQVFLGLFGIMAIVIAGYGLSQFNLDNPKAVVSFLPAEVWLTTFLVMVIPFGLAVALGEGPSEIRTVGALAVGLMTVCLIATQSRAGLVALVAEFWVIVWFIRSVSAKIVAALATVCVIATVLVVFNPSTIPVAGLSDDIASTLPINKDVASVIHRFDIWGFTLSEIAKHWLVGIGYGSHSYLLLYGQNQEVVMPGHSPVMRSGTHNIFLYLALHVGLPGMLLFGWFFLRVVLRTSEEYRQAHDWLSKAILVGSVVSVVGMTLRLQFDQMLIGTLAVLFWVLLAIAVLSYPSYNQVTQEVRVRRSGALNEV